MTTRNQRTRLISRDDVDRIFDDAAIKHIAEQARLPSGADLKRFGHSIREAVRQYLADASALQPGEFRQEMESLARKVKQALDGKLGALEAAATALEALPHATRNMLEGLCYPHSVPSADDLSDPVLGREAPSLLYGLLHAGADWKPGRKREGGRRSRTRLVGIPRAPRVRRGRPRNWAEFMLCTWLGATYLKAKGKMPPKHADRRNPGPFVRLVREVLRLARAAEVDPVELVETYGRSRH